MALPPDLAQRLAKKGYSQDEINTLFSGAIAQPATQESGPARFIPAVTSILGGILGSAIGPAGTIGGSAAGGALGRFLQGKVTGQNATAGDIGKEALIGGASAGAGELLGLGARAIGLGVRPTAEVVAGNAARTAPNLLERIGASASRSVVRPQVVASPFAAAEEESIVKTLQGLGIKGPARAQYEQLGPAFEKLSGQIQQKLATSTAKPVAATEVKTAIENALSKSLNYDESIPAYTSAKDKLLGQIIKKGDSVTAKDLFELKQNLNQQLSRAFDKVEKGMPLTPQEEVGLTVWNELDNMIAKADPSIKELTLTQSKLYAASKGLKTAGNASFRVPLTGTGIPGAARAGQGALDLFGRTASRAGANIAAGSTPTASLLSQITAQTAPRAISGLGGSVPPTSLQDLADSSSNYGSGDTGGSSSQSVDDVNNKIAQVMILDLAQTGGKNIDKIGVIGKLLQPQQAKPLSAEAQKLKANADSGLKAINEFESIISKDKSALAKLAVPGSFGARKLATTRNEIQDIISRLRTGAAINAQEEKFYRNQLPTVFDDPETVKYKLGIYRDFFSHFSNQQGQSDQLGSILEQLSGGQ